jgi:hypothetical protein
MLICTLCRFATELDDVALRLRSDACICLGCFGRQTGSTLPMPPALRRTLSAVLTAAEAGAQP